MVISLYAVWVGKAAALASLHHGRSTTRQCCHLWSVRGCSGRRTHFWAPSGPGGQLWCSGLCLSRGENTEAWILTALYKWILIQIIHMSFFFFLGAQLLKLHVHYSRLVSAWGFKRKKTTCTCLSLVSNQSLICSSYTNSNSVRLLLIKVFQARGSSLCLQPYGQPITTVLCFMPPRPQDWIRWTTPSRTLDATTTWQKPLTRSISIIFLMAWRTKCGGQQNLRADKPNGNNHKPQMKGN